MKTIRGYPNLKAMNVEQNIKLCLNTNCFVTCQNKLSLTLTATNTTLLT